MPCDVMGTGTGGTVAYVISRQLEVCGPRGCEQGELGEVISQPVDWVWWLTDLQLSTQGYGCNFFLLSWCSNERDRDGGEVYFPNSSSTFYYWAPTHTTPPHILTGETVNQPHCQALWHFSGTLMPRVLPACDCSFAGRQADLKDLLHVALLTMPSAAAESAVCSVWFRSITR